MAKCIICKKSNANYFTNNDEPICDNCIGEYFNCPDCGRIFLDWGADAGSGKCIDCEMKSE